MNSNFISRFSPLSAPCHVPYIIQVQYFTFCEKEKEVCLQVSLAGRSVIYWVIKGLNRRFNVEMMISRICQDDMWELPANFTQDIGIFFVLIFLDKHIVFYLNFNTKEALFEILQWCYMDDDE